MREQDAEILHEVPARARGFGHREHLELAWRYLAVHPPRRAELAMADALRHITAPHGAPGRYHETLDRGLLRGHYSSALLAGASARRSWRRPDLRPLPTSP